MKKNDFPRILFCALFIVFLIPVTSALQQYSCFDFDPIIYGKSVQTVVSQDGKFIATGSPVFRYSHFVLSQWYVWMEFPDQR